jgi:hypothetical protein
LAKFNEKGRDLLSLSDAKGIAAEIPDFGSLATCMQECSKPVYALTQNDTARVSGDHKPYSGVVWDDTKRRMEEWRDLFAKLVKTTERTLGV